MKITVLIDNQTHPEKDFLEAEHGLSFYIETEREKILLDVGASDKFLKNAKALGIDIAEADTLILSHAHSDHTGGLDCFLQNNNKAKIYLSSRTNNSGYYSNRRGLLRNISINYKLVEQHKERFVEVSDNLQLSPTIKIISQIPAEHSLPKANCTLLAGDKPDTFNHEIALLITEGRQNVLFSSCTHLGLLNTLKSCGETLPTSFIGGLHLVDSDETNTFETEQEYKSMAETIRSKFPQLQIFTGHCTGCNAKNTLAKLLPAQFHTFHTGLEITL